MVADRLRRSLLFRGLGDAVLEGICQSVVLKREFAERIVVCRGSDLRFVELPLDCFIERSFSLCVLIGCHRLVPLVLLGEAMGLLELRRNTASESTEHQEADADCSVVLHSRSHGDGPVQEGTNVKRNSSGRVRTVSRKGAGILNVRMAR